MVYICANCYRRYKYENNYDKHINRSKKCIKRYRLVDLCAGTGGFSLGLSQTDRIVPIYANDMVSESKEAYDINFKHKLVLKDLHDISVKKIPAHDILTAGWPCQPFSQAGLKKGFSDERSNIFWKLLKIIKYHKPKVVIFENVKNLKSHDKGNTFKIIQKSIHDIGYYMRYSIINTCKTTDIPQNRERIYIVCFKDKLIYDKFNFTNIVNTDKVLPISNMLEGSVPSKYYYSDRFKVWDIINKNVTDDISTDTVYQFRRHYVRENKSNVFPTLTKNMGSGGHNVPIIKDSKGIRKITPRECFNLQGFPNTYKLPNISDSALYRLAGNAITVPVVKLIGDEIVSIL